MKVILIILSVFSWLTMAYGSSEMAAYVLGLLGLALCIAVGLSQIPTMIIVFIVYTACFLLGDVELGNKKEEVKLDEE